MEKANIKKKIVAVVKEKLSVDDDVIKNAKSFEDLGADSLDLVEIIMSLEEQFEVEISDKEAESITSIDQAVDIIYSKKSS